jgi:hypothetical protein
MNKIKIFALSILVVLTLTSAGISIWATYQAKEIAEKAPELLKGLKPWNPNISSPLIGGAGSKIPSQFSINKEARDAFVEIQKDIQQSIISQREKEYELIEYMAEKTAEQYENSLSLMEKISLAFADIFKVSIGTLFGLLIGIIAYKKE